MVKELDLSAGGFPEHTYVGNGTTVKDVQEEIARLTRELSEAREAICKCPDFGAISILTEDYEEWRSLPAVRAAVEEGR